MTKPRDDNSIEAAVLAVIHHLTIGVLAKLVDRGEGTIRHWTDPDHDGRPTIQQCILMDAACIERGIRPPLMTAYLAQVKQVGRAAEQPVGDLLMENLELSESVGMLHGLVRQARDIGGQGGVGITANEAARLSKGVRIVQAQLDDVKSSIALAARQGRRK